MKKIFFVLAAVIVSNQLMAQDSTGKSLDEAVITANKYPNKTSLTGKVVTIISREQIEKAGGKDLSQLLSEQAGIYIGGANSNAGKDKSIYLRGARIDHTLITIDGVPVYDPSGIGGNFDLRNLSIANIERIEILKGSQSTLYGSDAIAGVINIITKRPAVKSITGNTGASYGSNETFKANAGINGRTGMIDYNASFSFHDTKGINEAIDNGRFPVTDRDPFQQSSVQLGLGIKATENIYIQPFFRYNHTKAAIDQGAFTDELDYTYTQKSWQAGLRNEFNFGKTKFNLIYTFNNIDRKYIDDSTESRNGFDTYSEGLYKGSEHFIDAYAIVPLHPQLKLIAGADFRSSKSDQLYSSIGFFGPYKTENSSDSLHQDQVAVYAVLNWNRPSGFNMETGGRVNFHSEYGTHGVFNINPSYFLNKKVKIFANLSSAYRTPSLYQLFSEYGNKELKPEAAITIEAGVQYYSPNDKFTGRVVGFSRHAKDVIFFFYNPVTFASQYINQDKQKDRGFELEASYMPSKKISIRSSYTFVTGEISTKTGNKDTTFNNLLRRPRGSFNINLSAQLTKQFFASTSLVCIGPREDAYYDPVSFSNVYPTLDSYALWDIYAEYGLLNNRLKLFADCRNITGKKYVEISGFNTLGFNAYGGIRFSF
ncbi:MAG: TonB-dependent receptor [Chitinophagaceae bacterium]